MNLFFTIGFKGTARSAEAVPLYAGRDKDAADRAGFAAVNDLSSGIELAMRYVAPAHGKIHRLREAIVLPVLDAPEGEAAEISIEAVLQAKDAEIEKLKAKLEAAGPVSEEDAKAMVARIGELEAKLMAANAAAVVVAGPDVDEAPVVIAAAEATTVPVGEVPPEAAGLETSAPGEAKPPKGRGGK